jgi:hypothetical protein
MSQQFNQIELREGSTYKAVEILERNNISVKIRSYGSSKTFLIPKNAIKEVTNATIEKRVKAYEECEQLINSFGIVPIVRTKRSIMYMLNDKICVVIHKEANIYKVELRRVDLNKTITFYDNLAKLYRIETLLKRIKGNSV